LRESLLYCIPVAGREDDPIHPGNTKQTNQEVIDVRTAITFSVLVLMPAWALAAAPEKFYYLGEVKLSSAAGKSMGSQVILLEKTHDRDNAAIVERAVVVQADGKVEDRTMRITVKDDNTFTLTDDAKTIDGSGTLFGPAWRWTYFKGTFKANNGVQIEDENFMADDSVISARKKVMAPDGKVIMYMDMSLKSVTPMTFEILKAGLMKK
jgi:hypothetical protein